VDPANGSGETTGVCERCGCQMDTDIGAFCEGCLLDFVRDDEARHEKEIKPIPEDVAYVQRLAGFLELQPVPDALYCPGCLTSIRMDAGVCADCQKEARSFMDVQDHARKSIDDITASWYVRLLDDAQPDFFAFILDVLEAEEVAGQFHARIQRQPVGFNPIFAHWTGYRSELFLPVREIGALQALLVRVPIDQDFAASMVELGTRLSELATTPWRIPPADLP
jgi:hypothetical protein